MYGKQFGIEKVYVVKEEWCDEPKHTFEFARTKHGEFAKRSVDEFQTYDSELQLNYLAVGNMGTWRVINVKTKLIKDQLYLD